MVAYSQWHYILGYLIVLIGHNWPIMLCVACGAYHAWRLYRLPHPRDVRLLYAWAALGFAYEYRKHLQGVFDEAVDFLLIGHLWGWNRWGHRGGAALLALATALALWLFWQGLRLPRRLPTADDGAARSGPLLIPPGVAQATGPGR